MTSKLAIIAHRTCPVQAPENSLQGIRQAAAFGIDGVEIDLRVSLDQRPFLMHDNTMRRTTGFRLPVELTPSRIVGKQRLSNDEPVPTLDAVFATLDHSLQLAVDTKTPWAIFPLVREIKRRGRQDRVLIWCTSSLAARYAARQLPGCEVAYLNDVRTPAGKLRLIARAVEIGARAISAHWLAIDAPFVAAAHGAGLKVYSYHGGADLSADKLQAGLDGLITDFPVEAREAIAALA